VSNQTDKNIQPDYVIFILIFVITFLSRYLFSENNFYDGDTVGVAFGSISYSLQNTRPHLPGYYLHVKLISLLSPLLKDLHQTMIFLSAFYSSVGAVFCFALLQKWFQVKTSLIITALIIFNPLVWFQGSTPEVYSFDLVLSSLFVLFALNNRTIYLTPALLALETGMRQTSGLLLLPLYIHLWYEKYKTEKLAGQKIFISHIAGLVIFLLWFIPMVNSAGGLSEYINLFRTNSPLPNISFAQNIFQFSSYCFFIFTPLIGILIFLKPKKKLLSELTDSDKNVLFILLLWLVPSIITFIFFTYHKGYFLISIIPLYAFIGLLLEKRLLKYYGILIVLIMEILFFTLVPYKELQVQSIIKPVLRTQNLLETWTDRTFSSYLMAYSRIKYQDDLIEELSSIVEKNKSKIIFLDPTIYLSARGIQFKYPGVTFITMDFYKPNSYYEYKGLDISAKTGLDNVLVNSLLITRRDFYNYYLKGITRNVNDEANYMSVLIEENYKDAVINRYQNLFTR
jgi:hypothetical protein